jgi:hypothetical protein
MLHRSRVWASTMAVGLKKIINKITVVVPEVFVRLRLYISVNLSNHFEILTLFHTRATSFLLRK